MPESAMTKRPHAFATCLLAVPFAGVALWLALLGGAADDQLSSLGPPDILSLARAVESELAKIQDVTCAYRVRNLEQDLNSYIACVWRMRGHKEFKAWTEVYKGAQLRRVALAFDGRLTMGWREERMGDTGRWRSWAQVDEGRDDNITLWTGPRQLYMSPFPGVPLSLLLTGTNESTQLTPWRSLVVLEEPMRILATRAESEGTRCTIVERECRDKRFTHKLWLDELRALRPVRVEIRLGHRMHTNVYHSIRLRNIGGHWFPTYARLSEAFAARPDFRSEWETTVSDVQINLGIDDSCFSLWYPLGMKVADSIAGRVYWVGGGHPRLPLEIIETLLK